MRSRHGGCGCGGGERAERQRCVRSSFSQPCILLVLYAHDAFMDMHTTTRLETRAKEFHYCASTSVCQTLMRNESNEVRRVKSSSTRRSQVLY